MIGGYLSGSLAIMSDAAHMFSDLASFIISLMAIHLSEKPAKKVALKGHLHEQLYFLVQWQGIERLSIERLSIERLSIERLSIEKLRIE
jgi:zinc transporter 2